MGKVSFDEIETEIIAPLKATGKEVAVRSETAVAVVGEDPTKGIYGEWGVEDIRLPRLNLVNKVGDLSNTFTPGTYVIDKETEINKIDPQNKNLSIPLRVIPVRLKAEYQESLPYDPDVRPRVFKTAEEVRLHGGVVAYVRGEGKFAKVGHIEFLIEAPADLSEESSSPFFYSIGDRKYARVLYTASSTAYAETASILYNDVRVGHLAKVGLGGGFYLLGAKIKTGDKGTWWIPSLKTAGEVSSDALAEVRAITG
jgi:hypothetical protein